jgi:signal transduction histidine kinase
MDSEKSAPSTRDRPAEAAPALATSVTSAAVERALSGERLRNARRMNLIRFVGVSFFFALFLLLGAVLGIRTWQGNLRYFAPYWVVTALLFVAGRKWERAARSASWAIALVDMPMVFLLQYATFPTTPNVAAVAGYTMGVYVLLLLIEALSLDPMRIYYSALVGACFEGLLQHLAGVDTGAVVSSFIIMGIAAATCSYGSRRITDLIAHVVADVTERQRAEEALRARDDFLSVASHELRTPLTNVQLNVEGLRRLITRRKEGAPLPDLSPRIDSAYASTQRLAGLIDRLLDVSRLRSGRFELDVEVTDLAHVAATVVEHSAEALAEARCALTLNAAGPVVGKWDRLRLEQVVTNLLSNAMKYGAGAPIVITVSASASHGELSVRDHGIGIAPANQARVFAQFERAVSKKDFSGLGLGLWICGQIVALHGGSIHLESETGQGAAFTVKLPRGTDAS